MDTDMTLPSRNTQASPRGYTGPGRKAAALFEVFGVLVAGILAAFYLIPLLGIKLLDPIFQSALNAPEPDFVSLSVVWVQTKSVQYGCLLFLAFTVGWWRRRLRPRNYGVTTAGQSIWSLIALGIVAFAVVALPIKLLWVAREFITLGQGSPFWVLLEKKWTASFWLFMAVASFAYQPVIEELFFRGYCQTRLEEDFGGIGAVGITALFFVLGHNQYHHLSILSIGNMIALIPCALGLGYVYLRTRSLIPGIILHAALNVPTKGIYDFLVPVIMIVVLILFYAKWIGWARDFCRQIASSGWKRAAPVGTVVLVVSNFCFERWPFVVAPVALAAFAIALLFEFRWPQGSADEKGQVV
jgi:membrane protease YdiL (CAAX protease family)